jgi:DNA polymerase-4
MSRDETFPHDINDDEELERELVALVTRAAFDLRSDGLAARTITVKIRDMDFRTRSARRTLAQPVVSDRILLKVSRELLSKLRLARRVPARLLGVSVSSLSEDPDADQMALFAAKADPDSDTLRDRALVRAVDRVRAKFGAKSVIPGRLTPKED